MPVRLRLSVCDCLSCLDAVAKRSIPACMPPYPSRFFCVSPPEGPLPGGSDPTVDTVSVQPIPTYWYYVMAGGAALVLLGSAALVLALCCHRYRVAAKKTQHSVAYHSSQFAGSPAPGPALEPTLTVRLEKAGRFS